VTESYRKIGICLFFVTAIGSLILLNLALDGPSKLGSFYYLILSANGLCLIILFCLVITDIRKLIKQLGKKEPGSKLTLRMLVMFAILAVLPVTALYGFSLQFINKSIDSWFNVEISNALNNSLDLGRESLGMLMRNLQKETEKVAEDLSRKKQERLPLDLSALRNPNSLVVSRYQFPSAGLIDLLRKRSQAEELSVLTMDGRVIAASSSNSNLLPLLPSENLFIQLRQKHSYIGLEPSRDGQLSVRVAVNTSLGQKQHILQAIYPFSPRIDNLANNVESGFAKYNELAYLRDKLKISFTITLTLVLLFSIASSIWAAFFYARLLTSPILELSKATSAVAEGNYETSVTVNSNDDLASLALSFNEMTRKIARSTSEIENQRNYLDAVMKQLSSGVITLSEKTKISTINRAAAKLLEIEERKSTGIDLSSLATQNKNLSGLIEIIQTELTSAKSFWERNISLVGSRSKKEIICKGTVLSRQNSTNTAHIIVMEDVTAVLQGQRDAAWSEMAKRLAHEIKNPLTPIKLSAERLILKLSDKLKSTDRDKLSQLSGTIIEQVETMTHMVDEFSGYTEKNSFNLQPVDLNILLTSTAQFFQEAERTIEVTLQKPKKLPLIAGDINSLRRLFNNLLKNSIEASDKTLPTRIIITAVHRKLDQGNTVEITILDQGPGIPKNLLSAVFEPYVTSKARGRGLGLAIVKKIIEEHNGTVKLENFKDNGALVTVHLPVIQSDKKLV